MRVEMFFKSNNGIQLIEFFVLMNIESIAGYWSIYTSKVHHIKLTTAKTSMSSKIYKLITLKRQTYDHFFKLHL